MLTYLTLLISHVYGVFYLECWHILHYSYHMHILYFIPSTAPCLCRSAIAHSYTYMYIFSFTPLDLCVLGSCWGLLDYLLDITALSELDLICSAADDWDECRSRFQKQDKTPSFWLMTDIRACTWLAFLVYMIMMVITLLDSVINCIFCKLFKIWCKKTRL